MPAFAKLITLPDVFRHHHFVVPDYQRGYAWDEGQVKALLDDIDHLAAHDHVHYTGTIVLSPRDNEAAGVYDIVDGQQRLTTVSILLAVLIQQVEDVERKAQLVGLYQWRGESGNQVRVFKLNKNIDQFYQEKVLAHESECKRKEYISEVRVEAAYKEISAWVKQQFDQGVGCEELLDRITSLLGFIVYQPDNNKEAGMMFEVINNRGKPLSELEKVKNYLIYYSIKQNKSNLRERVDLYWGEILKNLAAAHHLKNPDEKLFLRSAVITYLGFGKEESQNIYETLKKKFPIKSASESDWEKLEKFVDFLRRASSYYEALMNEYSPYRTRELKTSPKALEYIELIRSQSSHAAILPIYMALMDKRLEIDSAEFIDALRMLECTNFRVYMTRNGTKRSDSGQGWTFEIAHQFYKNFGDEAWINVRNEVEEANYRSHAGTLMGALYDVIDEYIPDKHFVEGLVLKETDTDDFYGWRGLRYFLMNYERKINEKRTIKIEKILKTREGQKSNDYLSIEHTWAKANDVGGRRKGAKSDIYHKRRLGNFMLLELGLNIQAQDKPIEEKIDIYRGVDVGCESTHLMQVEHFVKDFRKEQKTFKDNGRVRHTHQYFADLYKSSIDRFEQRLVTFAKKRWSVKWAEKYWDEV